MDVLPFLCQFFLEQLKRWRVSSFVSNASPILTPLPTFSTAFKVFGNWLW